MADDVESPLNGFSEEEIAEFRQAFSVFDKDGNGHISADEVGNVMSSLGLSTNMDLDELVQEFDTDGNGTIEFEEFVGMMARRAQGVDEDEEIREAFRLLDRDEDGKISAHELRYIMTMLGEKLSHEEVDDMLKEAGVTSRGLISMEDFLKLVTSN